MYICACAGTCSHARFPSCRSHTPRPVTQPSPHVHRFPYRYNTESVSHEVLAAMKQKMVEGNSSSSHSFLLDDDSTLPFAAAEVLGAMDDKDLYTGAPSADAHLSLVLQCGSMVVVVVAMQAQRCSQSFVHVAGSLLLLTLCTAAFFSCVWSSCSRANLGCGSPDSPPFPDNAAHAHCALRRHSPARCAARRGRRSRGRLHFPGEGAALLAARIRRRGSALVGTAVWAHTSGKGCYALLSGSH